MNSYGGSATYAHIVAGGNFNAAMTVTENVNDKTSEDSLGFSTTENYSAVVLGWHVNGSFGYAQNVQTLLVTYMNSYYNYSGNRKPALGKIQHERRRGRRAHRVDAQPGTANSSESYNASIGLRHVYHATGSYSKASGQALATGAGLVPVPMPSPVLPSGLVSLYGGNSYSVGLSSTPMKHLVLSAAYAKSTSNTYQRAVSLRKQNDEFNALIQYQVRKLDFNSGYRAAGAGLQRVRHAAGGYILVLYRGIALVQLLLRRSGGMPAAQP